MNDVTKQTAPALEATETVDETENFLQGEYGKAVAELARVEKEIAALESREREIKSALLQGMEANGVKKFAAAGIAVTYYAPTVSSKLDSKGLRAKYPEIATEFTRETTVSAYIKVKVTETEGDNGA